MQKDFMLKHTEINENSIIVILFEDGKKEPYFVSRKKIGIWSKKTRLIGERVPRILKNPRLYPCREGGEDEFYTSSDEVPNGRHFGVSGYRKLNLREKKKLRSKISPIHQLKGLLEVISNS